MKKILSIQSRQLESARISEQEILLRAVSGAAEVDFLSALDEKLAWTTPDEILKGYDGIVLGGSGDFDLHGGREERAPARLMAAIILSRIRALITYAFAQNTPVLGICFGHQLIAEMYGGHVTHDSKQKKSGSFEVRLTDDGRSDPLFSTLPDSFLAQYGHKDSVTGLPEGAVLLALGSACLFSALRYGKKVYTMQFHPELTAQDSIQKLKESPGYLPQGIAAESIVRESPEASKLIPAWIERVVEERELTVFTPALYSSDHRS